MGDRIFIQLPGDYGRLKAECRYTIEDMLDEIERLSDENDSLKAQMSNLEDEIKENYRPISEYDRIGMTRRDFV